jgi:hypothetical protein
MKSSLRSAGAIVDPPQSDETGDDFSVQIPIRVGKYDS